MCTQAHARNWKSFPIATREQKNTIQDSANQDFINQGTPPRRSTIKTVPSRHSWKHCSRSRQAFNIRPPLQGWSKYHDKSWTGAIQSGAAIHFTRALDITSFQSFSIPYSRRRNCNKFTSRHDASDTANVYHVNAVKHVVVVCSMVERCPRQKTAAYWYNSRPTRRSKQAVLQIPTPRYSMQ